MSAPVPREDLTRAWSDTLSTTAYVVLSLGPWLLEQAGASALA